MKCPIRQFHTEQNNILQFRFLCCEKKNIQHEIIFNPDNKSISVHNHYEELLPTFILAYWLSIFLTLTLSYLEVIAKI